MAEPERSQSDFPISSTSPAAASGQSALHAHVSRSSHLPTGVPGRLWSPFLAALGAVFGFLIGSGIFGEIFGGEERNLLELSLIAVLTGAAAYWFFDPIMELARSRGEHPHELPKDRRLVTSLVVVATVLIIAILHHSLAEAIKGEGPAAVIVTFLVYGGTAFLTTLLWIRGVQRFPRRAATWGSYVGGLAGAVIGPLICLALLERHVIPGPSAGETAGLHYAGIMARGIGVGAFLFLLPGLLGGLAIEKGWGSNRKSPTRGIFFTLAVLSVGLILLTLFVTRAFPAWGNLPWLFALQLIFLNVGWGLGPFLHHESCDHLFGGALAAGAVETVLPDMRGGTVVVPIDRGRPFPMPGPGESGVAGHPVSPQVLLLKPTGSRLWALVVLVLALAVGGWAYTTGILRTDPEIVGEIEARFQLDSGLHGKFLRAQSTDHNVTLSGSVDNGLEHTAALQQASSVRGVRQLIDQVQVAPPAPAKTVQQQVPVVAPPPVVIRPSINISRPTAVQKMRVNNVQTAPNAQRTQKPGTPPQPSQATPAKKQGFFSHIFGRNKNKNQNNQNSNTQTH